MMVYSSKEAAFNAATKVILKRASKAKISFLKNKVVATFGKDEKNVFKYKTEGAGEAKIGVACLMERDENKLSEYCKSLIPEWDENWQIDEDMKAYWEDMSVGLEMNEPIYIGGPVGCGKTKSVKQLAAMIFQPVKRISINRDIKANMLIGQRTLYVDEGGNTITGWKDGVVTEAVRNGWWLIFDEIDQMHPDVLMRIQGLLEGDDLVLIENDGEIIKPNKYFRIIATANTFGRGDETGMYAGSKIMNEATLDRFHVIKYDYLSSDIEESILMDIGVEKGIANKMVEIAKLVRNAFDDEDVTCTLSTRSLVKWAKKAVVYKDVRRAAKVSLLNKLSKDDESLVKNLMQRHFGA